MRGKKRVNENATPENIAKSWMEKGSLLDAAEVYGITQRSARRILTDYASPPDAHRAAWCVANHGRDLPDLVAESGVDAATLASWFLQLDLSLPRKMGRRSIMSPGRDAIERAIETHETQREAAESLGVSHYKLYKWRREAGLEIGPRGRKKMSKTAP